jgi:vancomycin resistance protein VanW
MFSPRSRLRYELSFRVRRAVRFAQNRWNAGQFATERGTELLPHLLQSHETPLFRNLKGVDSRLFANKRENLRLAIHPLNRILIPPGKTFSFWHLLGEPDAARGFLPGLVIQRGAATEGVGGGLCQLSNAIFWLALHTDLLVTERHRHSFDLFPDEARLIPFGTGATVFYNYKDLRLRNPTPWTYQFDFEVSEESLRARIFCSTSPLYRFEIRETDHQFERIQGELYRSNKIWKVKKGNPQDGAQDDEIAVELLFENHCRCQYDLPT